MATVPAKKFALATTATAVLAFLLIVPTVLVASGALGQGGSGGTGYTVFVPLPVSAPVISVSTPVGKVTTGQNVTVTFDAPKTQPLETASVLPTATVNALVADKAALNAALTDTTQLHQIATAPAALTTLLDNAEARATILANPTAVQTLLASGLGASTLLQNEAARTEILAQVSSNPALATTLVTNAAALNTLAQDQQVVNAVVDQIVNNPTILQAAAQNPAAMGALLQNEQARVAITSNPAALEAVLQGAMEQRHVGAVSLTAGTAGSNVQVSVNEFLANDPKQTAISVPEGTSLASIQLQVAAPDAGGATTFHALKIIEVSAPGLPKGGVEKATITFKVTQAELLAMGKTTADIRLLHMVDGKAVPLPTTLVGGPDADGVYTFTAETPSFSYFVIGAASVAQATSGFAGLGIALLILAVLAVLAIALVVVMKKKQS